MLRSADEILGYRLEPKDGQLGRVRDLYFDDERWDVRYFVADTRRWLAGRRVLLPAAVVGEPDWIERTLPVELTEEQVRRAPAASGAPTVSVEQEEELARLYQASTNPPAGLPVAPRTPQEAERSEDGDDGDDNVNHLRSLREVSGYRIQAIDGLAGRVRDLIAETEGWIVRYLVIDSPRLLSGEKLLFAPAWIEDIDWAKRRVKVELTRGQVRKCPRYDPSAPVNREVETRLYDFNGRPLQWPP